MLSRIYINSKITKVGGSYKLDIQYSYYYIMNYNEVYVFQTLQEAKDKLIHERCHGRISVEGDDITKC